LKIAVLIWKQLFIRKRYGTERIALTTKGINTNLVYVILLNTIASIRKGHKDAIIPSDTKKKKAQKPSLEFGD